MTEVIALVIVEESTEVGIPVTKDDAKLARQPLRS